MRKGTIHLPILTTAAALLTSGCVYSHHAAMTEPAAVVETSPYVVTEAPPAPKVETVGVAPDADHVWVSGYWMRANQRWVWVPGHWEVRPRAGVTWVPGEWNKNLGDRGWKWTPGHWE